MTFRAHTVLVNTDGRGRRSVDDIVGRSGGRGEGDAIGWAGGGTGDGDLEVQRDAGRGSGGVVGHDGGGIGVVDGLAGLRDGLQAFSLAGGGRSMGGGSVGAGTGVRHEEVASVSSGGGGGGGVAVDPDSVAAFFVVDSAVVPREIGVIHAGGATSGGPQAQAPRQGRYLSPAISQLMPWPLPCVVHLVQPMGVAGASTTLAVATRHSRTVVMFARPSSTGVGAAAAAFYAASKKESGARYKWVAVVCVGFGDDGDAALQPFLSADDTGRAYVYSCCDEWRRVFPVCGVVEPRYAYFSKRGRRPVVTSTLDMARLV